MGIIIPTLDEERALPPTLASLESLNFDEIIVVDGGSRDQTQTLVESYQVSVPSHAIRVIESLPGRARQMNAGASESRADIVVFLHADTRLPVDARAVIERVASDSQFVGGRFDVQFEQDRGYAWVISRMMNFRSRWSGISTGDQALFVRRTVFQQLGGFEDIPIMEDIEFTSRLKRVGKIAALRSKVITSFRRWEQRGPFRTIINMWTLRFLYWMGVRPDILHQYYGNIR
ncbi:MAG: TIGR04283 family arsenosugar biosynthesis glycosyltransferase [Nitrospirota bacterium]|nr:MAG: TIGR04283 family arsenosugar biosynthesis glycosyltransferase [Nitrospirota bacterium]